MSLLYIIIAAYSRTYRNIAFFILVKSSHVMFVIFTDRCSGRFDPHHLCNANWRHQNKKDDVVWRTLIGMTVFQYNWLFTILWKTTNTVLVCFNTLNCIAFPGPNCETQDGHVIDWNHWEIVGGKNCTCVTPRAGPVCVWSLKCFAVWILTCSRYFSVRNSQNISMNMVCYRQKGLNNNITPNNFVKYVKRYTRYVRIKMSTATKSLHSGIDGYYVYM